MTKNQSQSFDTNDSWEDLPEDWGQDSYQKALLTLETVTTTAAMHAPEALQFLIDLARGRIKEGPHPLLRHCPPQRDPSSGQHRVPVQDQGAVRHR